MKTLNKILIASAIAVSSMCANAKLIATDWQAEGDSLATLDEATGIEWLDLTQTKRMSINQVEGLLSSTFSGWRLPTRSEVTEMMMTAFTSQAITLQGAGAWQFTGSTLNNQADNFRALFGKTYSNASSDYSRGLFKNDIGESISVIQSGVSDTINNSHLTLYSSSAVTNNINYSHVSFGVYLVSDGGTTFSSINNPLLNANNANAPINAPISVPLPATVLLMGLGLTGLVRRKDK